MLKVGLLSSPLVINTDISGRNTGWDLESETSVPIKASRILGKSNYEVFSNSILIKEQVKVTGLGNS